MPKAIADCNVLVAKAIAADQAKDYPAAVVLYKAAIRTLLQEVEQQKQPRNNDPEKRQQLKNRVKELLHRAEKLQRYLDGAKAGKHLVTNKKTRATTSSVQPRANTGKSNKNRDLTRVTSTSNNKNRRNDNNHGNNESEREKEWSFDFDLSFHVKSKLKTPTPSSSDNAIAENSNGEEPSHLMKLLRLLGR